MSWQFLGTLGVGMVVAAFLGGGLAISNVVKIPVVRTRGGFVALVIGGLVITGMGYLTWRDRPPETEHENAIVLMVLAKPVADESGSFHVDITIPASTFCPEDQCQVLAAGDQSLKWTTEPYDVSP